MTIIAITGAKGSGKTTLGKYLEQEYDFERIAMAAPLKNMLRAVGLTEEQLNGDLKELPTEMLCGRSPRHAMQTLGTEWGRVLIGQELWTNLWKHQVSKSPKPVVCDDIRYPNELSVAKELGAISINVRRAGTEGKDAHSSEIYAQVMKTDVEIVNNGSFDEFYSQFREKVLPLISDNRIKQTA